MPSNSPVPSSSEDNTSLGNSAQIADNPSLPDTFRLSPLIRITLLGLYVALIAPLPFLAEVVNAPVPSSWLVMSAILGWIALYGALSEQVVLDEHGIQVIYPQWVRWCLRRGWSLSWADIKALKPRSTGQGGLVYYFLSTSDQAYLLPMRVAGFARLVRHVETKTGIDMQDVRPLSQPWMYLILLGATLMLLAIDGWTIWTAITLR